MISSSNRPVELPVSILEALTPRTGHPTFSGALNIGTGGVIMRYADPFDALLAFQQALENRLSSDWLGGGTAGTGSFPPINVFQQGDDLVALIELPGVRKEDLNIQVQEGSLRISGNKNIDYPEKVSLHRRERLSGAFDRTLVVPMQIDPDGIKAEYNDGLLALFIPPERLVSTTLLEWSMDQLAPLRADGAPVLTHGA
jgi:HSP20 family protein